MRIRTMEYRLTKHTEPTKHKYRTHTEMSIKPMQACEPAKPEL